MRQLNCWAAAEAAEGAEVAGGRSEGRGPAAARVNGQKQLTADKLTAKTYAAGRRKRETARERVRESERGGHKMQKENNVTAENCQFVGPYRLEKTLGKGQTGKSDWP